MTVAHIDIPAAELADLCRRYGIRKLALFGSVLTHRFSDGSDVDVLASRVPAPRTRRVFPPGRYSR
ncbi:MAG: nucleotidyltransferase family protein [Bryobacteraceae bacterium]